MTKIKLFYPVIGSIIILMIATSCKKGKVPIVETSQVTNVTTSRAVSGGNITNEGSGTIISRGVCWSISSNPTIVDNKTTDGAGAGSYISHISGLAGNAQYFVRAYATNDVGTGYGMAMALTTEIPTVPSNGLVAYYPFNGNANDQTSNGNNGIVNGATLTVDRTDFENSAYYFDGVSNNITGPTINWPLGNSARTISIWIKLSTLPANGENNFLIEYGPEIEECMNVIYFQYTQVNGKRIVYDGYFDGIVENYDFLVDTWYNIVSTYDGTLAKLFVNGQLLVQDNKPSWNTVASEFRIGGWYNSISFINGTIDDLRIYNRALNTNEILALYNEIP
jgi:hypothetical protein